MHRPLRLAEGRATQVNPMELHQLRTLVAVADAAQLTRAAERLGLSQPAVSAHIRALEKGFGAKLFERVASGMMLTRAGRELLPYAEQVLRAAEAMRQAAAALKGTVSGRLRLGTIVDPELLRLGEFLGRAVERFPGLEIEVHQEVTGAALEAVRDGTLDASFYFGDLDGAGIGGVRLAEVAYRVVAPAAWAERVRGAGPKELAALPWVLSPPSSTVHRIVHALFAQQGITPSKVIEADNEQVIASLVAAGVGLSVMREQLAEERKHAGEIVRLKKIHPRATLWFIHRADRAQDPAIAALLGVLRETWSEDRAGRGRRGAPVAARAA
jgi:DNA-binding transcriptional LysR family regulator